MFDIYFEIAAQNRFFLQIHSLVIYQGMHYPPKNLQVLYALSSLPEADTFDRIPIFRYSDSYLTTNSPSENRADYNQTSNCREANSRRVHSNNAST